ncbi:M14 family metallopeptidase [Dawidia soli]|uniref:M14 family metallopeptidase n=1 Tax=Dawidia soli TaxID=2782352 RepID=A0AAP2GFT3_9BACT|nr:M14 family metallopeptidase [Dawidia soli]MBT1685416.1 M14 family metallopeptidase [Dawidia soli]
MRFYLLFVFSLFLLPTVVAQKTWPAPLILTPEKTAFQKTSTCRDVFSFLEAIASFSAEIKVISIGKSPEGKDIQMAILSRNGIITPAAAKNSHKAIVYVQGNIHAGEVEGKEALMMLMRDILLGDKNRLLDSLVLLFVPAYNTDSNDKMEKGRRPSQEDSPVEVGIRENSQGWDLNRDGVKQEALETRALFTSVLNTWDPHVFVDLHTTNGTWHAYSLTWAPGYLSSGSPSVYQYTHDQMLRTITQQMREKYDLLIGPYGDYDLREGWPVKNFYTYNHHPRYLINQLGLRNRIAILSEAFAHERFYQRIHSTYSFVTEILDYSRQHAREITRITRTADEATVRKFATQSGQAKAGVRFKMVSGEVINNFLTYDYIGAKKDDGTMEWFRTGNTVKYDSVKYFAQFQPTIESTIPRGYIIPAAHGVLAQQLQQLGIRVTKLPKGKSFQGDVFQIKTLQHGARKFEGHLMATAEGTFEKAVRKFKAGDYIVDLAQPLGNLAFYVLEPQSDDGFITWNFLDSYLEKAGINNHAVEYPVFKYYN